MAGTSIVLTTAKPGSGKSYRRCAGAIPEILDDGYESHISNFPVRFDDNKDGEGMLAACKRLVRIREVDSNDKVKFRAITEEEVRAKIVRIPQEVLDKWAIHKPNTSETGHGPWDYFEGPELDRAHIALDEAQLYCPKTGCQAAKKAAWAAWLSEIRHRGAKIEFITQDPLLLADEITKLAGIRIEIFTRDDEWLSLLGCHFRALRYFWCKLIRKRIIYAVEVEYTGTTSSKWEEVRRFMFCINGKLFGRYDSHSKPKTGVAGKEVDEPWQRYGWLGLIAWFFRTYFIWQIRNAAFIVVFVYMCFLGGLSQVASLGIHGMTSLTKSMLSANQMASVGEVAGGEKSKPSAEIKAGQGGTPATPLGVAAGETMPEDAGEYRLAGLTPHVAHFEGLGWVEIGEVLGDGDELSGLRLETIDWRRSLVVLSDGRRVRMFAADRSGIPASAISGSVPGGGDIGEKIGSGREPGTGQAGVVERGRDEPGRPKPLAGSGTWNVDHFRGSSPGKAGND